jgi:hypothetical protein
MVVFGLVSTMEDAFGNDVSFVVVAKIAFIFDASPLSASVLPLEPSDLRVLLFSVLFFFRNAFGDDESPLLLRS